MAHSCGGLKVQDWATHCRGLCAVSTPGGKWKVRGLGQRKEGGGEGQFSRRPRQACWRDRSQEEGGSPFVRSLLQDPNTLGMAPSGRVSTREPWGMHQTTPAASPCTQHSGCPVPVMEGEQSGVFVFLQGPLPCQPWVPTLESSFNQSPPRVGREGGNFTLGI